MILPVFSQRVSGSPEALGWNLFGAQILGLTFALLSLMKRRRESKNASRSSLNVEITDLPTSLMPPPLIELQLRREHVVQIIAQGLVYVGWCIYWDTALLHLPLLYAQIIFAYLMDMGLAWRRYPTYRLGLGPIPIVFSTNLFLFFTDAAFVWQWILIAFALISREIFRWRREGRDVHIFNPSAIALSVFAVVLIYTETMHFTWGEAIARAHGNGPYSYEVIFAAGLLVSAIFTVGFTISSAVIVTLSVGEIYFAQNGIFRYVDTGIPIAVFLGMNLLVTDPVSSPWRRDAKVIYGALYGLSVFILYGLLRDLERPPTADDVGLSAAFCDKLLAVPLLNLSARRLDRCMAFIFGDQERGITRWVLHQEQRLNQLGKGQLIGRLVFIIAWCGLFVSWVRPEVHEHKGNTLSFWETACDKEAHPYACENFKRVSFLACESNDLHACHNLALSLEESNPARAQTLYQVACQKGQFESCNHLGGMLYKTGEESRDRVIIEKALSVLRVACDGDVLEACTRQAMILRSDWIDRSIWTQKEWRLLWSLLERGCEGGEPYACLELSQYHLMPPPVAQERCQAGDQLACITVEEALKILNGSPMRYPRLAQSQPHPLHAKARAQLSIACGAEMQVACVNLGWMLWRGDGGPRDAKRALNLLETACRSKVKEACQRAQWMRQQLSMSTPAPTNQPKPQSPSKRPTTPNVSPAPR